MLNDLDYAVVSTSAATIVERAGAAYWTRSENDVAFHRAAVIDSFERLALALGYTVSPSLDATLFVLAQPLPSGSSMAAA